MSYINENSFSRWIIEKLEGLTTLGLQKLSETLKDYVYLILTSQTSTRGPIIGHEARNLDAQRVLLNTFENVVSRKVDIPEHIQRFQKTLQYAWSKVDYVTSEFIYMLRSDMNLRIGRVKIKIVTNVKINLDGEKDKPDVKPKKEPDNKSNKEQKQDIKVIRTKPKIRFKKEDKLDIEMMETEPDTNKITYKDEKTALILGITSIFTVWWIFKRFISFSFSS